MAVSSTLMLLLASICLLPAGRGQNLGHQNLGGDSFFSEWSLGPALDGGRAAQPTCVDIPRNLSLCHGIRYSKMRLPNLLDHDSMSEVLQQAASWVPLLNVRCHADTQLFLCSLFSPVCLDRPIYPCRGLCERVRVGCEGRMKTYGYPWPDMLRCDKFPMDNDMCIGPLNGHSGSDATDSCEACDQVETYENILDNFCRADFVVRTKLRRMRRHKVSGKKAKVLKMSTELRDEWRRNKRPNLVLELGDSCCSDHFNAMAASSLSMANANDRFLVMGQKRNGQLLPTLILPWSKKSKAIRSAVKVFKKINCSNLKAVFGVEAGSEQTTDIDNGRQRRGKKLKKPGSATAMRKSKTTTAPPTTTASPSTTTSTTTTTTSPAPTRPKRRGHGHRNRNGHERVNQRPEKQT